MKSITKGSYLWDIKITKPEISKKIYFYSDELLLVGNLYQQQDSVERPYIILLHGTNVLGRKQPLILSLADVFYELNYNVLTFDFRGYGESEDPKYPYTPQDFNFAKDVCSSLDYLTKERDVKSQIFVVAHSFGAGVALSAFLNPSSNHTKISKLVLFGPPRRVSEKILNPDATHPHLLERFISHMHLETVPNDTILRTCHEERNIENYSKFISESAHLPILLIDGGDEDPKDIRFIREIWKNMPEKLEYWTVPNADHYLNTGYVFGKPAYCTKMLGIFVRSIDQWFGKG